MIKIAVFTATRAEYGLMKVLISKLQKDRTFDLHLIISGTHLEPSFGNTIEEINSDEVKNVHLVSISSNREEKKDISHQTAETIKLVSNLLDDLKPEYFVILGDRFESFGAAIASHLSGVKNVHLHGGETSLGAIDDKLRHSISQLSTFHFTSLDSHKKKVEQIIGSSRNVFNVGPMVLDGLLNLKKLSKIEFERKTGFRFSQKSFLITYHPETLASDSGLSGFRNLLKVLKNYNCSILFTSPNADFGSKDIIKLIKEFISNNKKDCFYVPSLGHELYLNALSLFDLIIGNSSSGIIEAPLLNKKVLNIGKRQKGRSRFGPVIDTNSDLKSISNALEKIFNIDEYEKCDFKKFKEIHSNNSPSDQIIKILKNLDS